jgi:hypothetical protein
MFEGATRGRTSRSVNVGLRPTNGDETQLEGGQYWPQPALGRLRAGLPALQSGFRLCAGPPGPALGATESPISEREHAGVNAGRRTEVLPTWARVRFGTKPAETRRKIENKQA